MKKTYLFLIVFCFAANVFAQNNTQPSATAQMHNAMTQSLANTEYYDEAHKNVPNAHGVATRENLTGEAELLRQGIGAPFVENKGGKYSQGASATNVRNYIAHSTADPNNEIIMVSPVKVPPVSDPVVVSDDDDIDAMMLSALGGDSAIKASQNSNYQDNYEIAVGQKEEQNFDMSDKIAAATKKQAAADRQYAALNANNKARTDDDDDDEPSFWGKIGKTFMQGLANVAIETTNYKYGTNIETIGNKNTSNSSGSSNQSCIYEGKRFYGQTCQYCINNKPRSSSACSQCCNSLGRSIYRATYPHRWGGDGRNYCFCMFNSSGTSGYLF